MHVFIHVHIAQTTPFRGFEGKKMTNSFFLVSHRHQPSAFACARLRLVNSWGYYPIFTPSLHPKLARNTQTIRCTADTCHLLPPGSILVHTAVPRNRLPRCSTFVRAVPFLFFVGCIMERISPRAVPMLSSVFSSSLSRAREATPSVPSQATLSSTRGFVVSYTRS